MRNSYPTTPDFQTLFETVPGLYLVLLPNAPRYTIAAMSDAFARATMTRREEILGRGIFEVFPDNPANLTATRVTALRASLGRVLSKRVPDVMAVQKYDIRHGTDAGGEFEERWWNQKNIPVFGLRGEVAAIIHAVEDVTEKHQLEEAHQLFAALVENSSDFIGIADPDGTPLYVNPAGRRMVGLAPDHPVRETRIPEYYPAEKQAFASDVIIKMMVENGRWSGETHFRHWKTGERIPVSDEHFMIRDARSGRTLGMGTITRDISEMRRAAAEREQLLARAQDLFDQASDSIFISDHEGRFTDVNATACNMLGYEREELIGKKIADVIPPEDFPRLAQTREYLFSTGMVEVVEGTIIRKDGTPIPIEVSGKVLPDGRWQAFVRDISKRKRIEHELRAANASLDAIIENIPLMLFIKDSKSLRFVRFNRAGEDLIGWPRETFIGKSDHDFWPESQAEFFVAKDREALRSGTVVDIPEEPLQTRNSGVRILHTKKVPIRDSAGHPIYLLGISEDITERRRFEKEQQFLAEASLALSRSLEYEQTAATVTKLVVQEIADWGAVDVIDEEGQLRRLKVASADPQQAELCAVLERMPPDRDLPYLMRSVIESRKSIVVEHVTPQYIGGLAQGPSHLQALFATRSVSLVGVPFLMLGEPLGALIFTSSNPSRVYGQTDLRLAEALADRVAAALENARLYRASVSATKLRDQVLGVVAHDLRSPLSNILMQTAALQEQGPESERHSMKAVEVIHRAATRMNRLIQDLLDIARIEAGQLQIARTRLSAGELMAEVADMQRSLASSSSLELRVEVARDVPRIWGDRDRLIQVFDNLIGNAIKFTKAGSITVGAASRDEEVVFWVADTGHGIAPENLSHVFDRFWQATRPGRHGAGLGLFITKSIVEAHGGRIWAESKVRSGSTFFFAIPQAYDTEDRPPKVKHQALRGR